MIVFDSSMPSIAMMMDHVLEPYPTDQQSPNLLTATKGSDAEGLGKWLATMS